eukprot:104242_1
MTQSKKQSGEEFVNILNQKCIISVNFNTPKDAFQCCDDIFDKYTQISEDQIVERYVYLRKYTALVSALHQNNIWQMQQYEKNTMTHQQNFIQASKTLKYLRDTIIEQYDGTKPHPNINQPTQSQNTYTPNTNISTSLATIIIPERMISEFSEKYSMENTTKNIETGGIILGVHDATHNIYTITHVLLPKQNGHANAVFMLNEFEWSVICGTLGLQIIGWIHTHPTQSCFMSSVDVHTQFNIQQQNNSAIGIVIAPTDTTKTFRLTKFGMDVLSKCNTNSHHVHANAKGEDISTLLYEIANNIQMDPTTHCIFIDIRKQNVYEKLIEYIKHIYLMSVRNPWAYLLRQRYKICENRKNGIHVSKINKPVALQVSGHIYPKAQRHEFYDIDEVQKYLKIDEKTKNIWNNKNALDQFFDNMRSQIIAILYVGQVIKNNENANLSNYEFAGIPEPTSHAWIISQCIPLSEGVPCTEGSLNVVSLKSKKTLDSIQSLLKHHGMENVGSEKLDEKCNPNLNMNDKQTKEMIRKLDGKTIEYFANKHKYHRFQTGEPVYCFATSGDSAFILWPAIVHDINSVDLLMQKKINFPNTRTQQSHVTINLSPTKARIFPNKFLHHEFGEHTVVFYWDYYLDENKLSNVDEIDMNIWNVWKSADKLLGTKISVWDREQRKLQLARKRAEEAQTLIEENKMEEKYLQPFKEKWGESDPYDGRANGVGHTLKPGMIVRCRDKRPGKNIGSDIHYTEFKIMSIDYGWSVAAYPDYAIKLNLSFQPFGLDTFVTFDGCEEGCLVKNCLLMPGSVEETDNTLLETRKEWQKSLQNNPLHGLIDFGDQDK